MKKNEILLFEKKNMKLEDIMLSEVNQSQNDKHVMFPLMYGNNNNKKPLNMNTEYQLLRAGRGMWNKSNLLNSNCGKLCGVHYL